MLNLILNTLLYSARLDITGKMGVVLYTKIMKIFGIFFRQCTYMVCVCDTIWLVVEPIRITKQPTMGRVVHWAS
jgi:hypothetical protein